MTKGDTLGTPWGHLRYRGVYSRLQRRLQAPTGVYTRRPASTGVYRRLQTYTGVYWLARSASALFRMRSKKRIGDRPTRPTDRPGTPHSSFQNQPFLTKINEIAAHSLIKIYHFRRNLVKFRRIPFLKMNNFRRKFKKFCENL